MKRTETTLHGLYVLEPSLFVDERGTMLEDYNHHVFEQEGLHSFYVQDHHVKSTKGVLRGLHYQLQRQQIKVVRVVFGEVYEVVVDIRRGSPTFGKWFGLSLSAWNMKVLYIPAGMAHGSLVLSETADYLYKSSDYYDPRDERGILWSDAGLNIEWPLEEGQHPVISNRDAALPQLVGIVENDLPVLQKK